jgi:predicted  nucleic acid-binding Zn-ribbon protein
LRSTQREGAVRKVDVLWQLQEIDRQLDAARAAQARLKSELGERSALTKLEAELKGMQDHRRELETQQRDLELLADERRGKIEADEGKLYGGRITNPKELSSLQDEVAQDKRQLGTVEDKLLEIMEQIEESIAQIAELEARLRRESEAWEVLQGRSRTQLSEAEAALTRLAGERSTVTTQLAPTEQSTYETLRRQKGGMAVAQVHQRTCQACRVGLTPSQEQRARQGHEIVTCNSCGRILFVPLA